MNVVFILSDDHRYDFMGFMETPPFLETPNLDRIREKGMHIRNAFVSTALCSPSRASILTGQYAHRHGVVDNQRLVPEGTVFFPQLLQDVGYQTAFFGKWHMGQADDDPRPGFDHWISFRGQGLYYDPTPEHRRRSHCTPGVYRRYPDRLLPAMASGQKGQAVFPLPLPQISPRHV